MLVIMQLLMPGLGQVAQVLATPLCIHITQYAITDLTKRFLFCNSAHRIIKLIKIIK